MNHSFSLILHNEPSEPTAELLLDQKHHLNLIRKVLDAPRDFRKNSLKCRSPSIHTHTHAHTCKGKKKKKEKLMRKKGGKHLPAERTERKACLLFFWFLIWLKMHLSLS